MSNLPRDSQRAFSEIQQSWEQVKLLEKANLVRTKNTLAPECYIIWPKISLQEPT